MSPDLGEHVDAVERALLDELEHWPWDAVAPLGRIVEQQLRAGGKRMRPRLAFAMADAHGGDPAEAVAAAASVELYHLASLVLDDVQDGSTLRRGTATVLAETSASVAVSVAAMIRSLSYHVIHRCHRYGAELRAVLHRELDEAATRLVLGQSMDVGWNAGWYATEDEFAYERMAGWKTGALFGCAAAMGARTAGSRAKGVERARRFGVSFGIIYQMADDYLDVFGADGALGRPRFEDIRGGKLSAPVVHLLAAMGPGARPVVECLRDPAADRSHLARLFTEYAVADRLRAEIARRAETLEHPPAPVLGDMVAAVLASVEPS